MRSQIQNLINLIQWTIVQRFIAILVFILHIPVVLVLLRVQVDSLMVVLLVLAYRTLVLHLGHLFLLLQLRFLLYVNCFLA